MRSGGTISPHDGSNIYGAGKLKAQGVSSGKTIPVVLKATRISAVWFGIAAIVLAAAAMDPALAGKKQKPARAPEEPVVHVDLKEPMIVVVSIGQQKVDVYRGTTLVTSSAVSTGTSAHPTFIGAFSIMQKARWHHSNIYSNAPMPWMNRLTWSGTAMHAGIVPGYPASHGCIRLTYAFAPKFFQMSSIGDNVITSRGRPKPTPIEHGALFQPLPPPALPMVEKEASLSPLERISTPIPAMAAAAASPVILAKAEMPTTVDSEAHPKVEEKAAPSDKGLAKDANAEAASAMTAIEGNAAETESDPYRVHAITPEMGKSQERLAAPDPAPAAESAAEDKPADKPVAAPAVPEPVAPKPEPTPVEIAAATPDLPPPAAAAKLNAGVDAASVQAAEPRSDKPLRMLLTRRTNRDRIIGMQTIFASLGYLPQQDFDGTLGKATITAVKTFQKANGMIENGVVNEDLVKKVYEVAGKGEPPAGHLYVRQDFDDVFDLPVSFRNPEEPLGTHVYIALNFAPGDTKIRWVTLDVTDGAGPAVPLDRLEIAEDVRQKISERLTPGSTFIVADTSINSAGLPNGGDFVVLARSTGAKISMTDEEPVARPKPRRRVNSYARRNYYDPWGAPPWGGRRSGGLFGRAW
jgi:lipoprotein-anchoring transpeptidase ErfK/SrfK/peptidoglycan hydrolase-like protein with peptidoglycan-binding domain